MSLWACPRERAPLVATAGVLRCAACGQDWAEDGAIAIFAAPGREADRARLGLPEIESLAAAMLRDGAEAAARERCAAWDCTRGPLEASWRYLLRFPPGGRLLEIGSGFGDDRVEFAPRAGGVLSIAPTVTHARLLASRLGPSEAGSIAVLPSLSRLPLPDRSVDAIAIDDDAAAAFGLEASGLVEAAAEWRRILRTGGTLVVGLTHRTARLRWRWPLALAGTAGRGPTLAQLIKRAGDTGARLPSFRRVAQVIEARGFDPPVVYSPLPSDRRAWIVAPIEDRDVVRWCLRHQVRRRSTAHAALIRFLGLLTHTGAAVHLAPYHFLYFRVAGPPADGV